MTIHTFNSIIRSFKRCIINKTRSFTNISLRITCNLHIRRRGKWFTLGSQANCPKAMKTVLSIFSSTSGAKLLTKMFAPTSRVFLSIFDLLTRNFFPYKTIFPETWTAYTASTSFWYSTNPNPYDISNSLSLQYLMFICNLILWHWNRYYRTKLRITRVIILLLVRITPKLILHLLAHQYFQHRLLHPTIQKTIEISTWLWCSTAAAIFDY